MIKGFNEMDLMKKIQDRTLSPMVELILSVNSI